MGFQLWNRLAEQRLIIKSLWAVIAALLLVITVLIFCLASAPNRLRIYLPPDLTQGTTISPHQVPKATVYAFAFQIFSAINSWVDGGEKEYAKTIHTHRHYLSSGFLHQLDADVQHRAANGELSRKRLVSAVADMGYQPSDVKILGNGAWLVTLRLEVVETLDGSVIKDVVMNYPLVVQRVQSSIETNPWGLVLAGYQHPPYRIKTVI